MNLLVPGNELLRKYVESIYIFEKDNESIKYTSYPSPNVAVGLFRDTEINNTGNHFIITPSDKSNYISLACNRLFYPLSIHYPQMVDEIAINFTNIGFAAFTQYTFSKPENYFLFSSWNDDIKPLFDAVFSKNSNEERLHTIESFLLKHYTPITDEPILNKAIGLLSDNTTNFSLQQIAEVTGIHYKDLYRRFSKYIGCSPAHYRKIARFRKSVFSKLNNAQLAKLADLCYEYNYSDQSHFIKQFQELTGENPKAFFKNISQFGHIVWKIS